MGEEDKTMSAVLGRLHKVYLRLGLRTAGQVSTLCPFPLQPRHDMFVTPSKKEQKARPGGVIGAGHQVKKIQPAENLSLSLDNTTVRQYSGITFLSTQEEPDA